MRLTTTVEVQVTVVIVVNLGEEGVLTAIQVVGLGVTHGPRDSSTVVYQSFDHLLLLNQRLIGVI